MTITKSETRDRYRAEQKTPDGTIVGFGDSQSQAVNEAIEKMKCPVCKYIFTSCPRCLAAKGGRNTNKNLTPEQASAKGKRMVMARIAKRKMV